MNLKIYDTTLRDGMQGEKINFSLKDKIEISYKLDELGIHYIEGGFPQSNDKERKFFELIKKENFKTAQIASFGPTRRPETRPENDDNLKILLKSETPVITMVGKGWVKHVKEILKTTEDENLRMIEDSVRYAKSQGREVILDIEHFFDGFLDSPTYALKTLYAARDGGADTIVLCDTNGGMIHTNIIKALKEIQEIKDINIGIHLHNDVGMAVANSIIALDHGCTHIQGTINGWGERCGNANLCTIIANIHFKVNDKIFSDEQLQKLTPTSKYISNLANIIPSGRNPYVGTSAFAHKAGQHADVIEKNPFLMEHLESGNVGNTRRVLLSELAGRASIAYKIREFGSFDKNSPEVHKIISLLKNKEGLGYEYEGAEASFELIALKILGKYKSFFSLKEYSVNTIQQEHKIETMANLSININGIDCYGEALAKGPVGALDRAFRNIDNKALAIIKNMNLVDYKVRVLNGEDSTEAKVRVFVKSRTSKKEWDTVGVSESIVAATWEALLDSYNYLYNFQSNLI